MRLEGIFARIEFFSSRETAAEHHAAMQALFEITDVSARADLKSDLLQELERQKLVLAPLRNHQHIDQQALGQLLNNIDQTIAQIYAHAGKIGAHLRENEWLMSIKQRMYLPGGASGFDLPAFHYWLHQPAYQRQNDLQQWCAPFHAIQEGVSIILRLLRESGHTISCVAEKGVFQLMQSHNKATQMLRVTAEDNIACVPEISANKYAINIRFISVDGLTRGSVCDQDIAFDLTQCHN
jgi:Uncharacterized protein conserved in bacteria